MKTSLISLFVAAATGSAVAQVQWTKENIASAPTARSNHAIVWMGDKALLFGGESAGYLDDTWTWDGQKWTRLTPTTSPSRRGGHAMAYDPLRKRVVLFTGWNGGSYIQDTWEFDGTNWKRMTPNTQPPPRDWTQMAFDPISKKVILFGGHDWRRHSNNGPGAWDDMWSWDGAQWTKLAPATLPPKRFGHLMVQAANAVVLIGGATPGASYDDMWRWIGTRWIKMAPTTLPGPRNFSSAAYDALRGRLVVHGGKTGSTVLRDTWEWNGQDWEKRFASGGPDATFGAMVFDPDRKVSYFVGGALAGDRQKPTNEIQSYAATNPAGFLPFGTGCKGSAGTPALSGTNPWIGELVTLTLENITQTSVALAILGTSNRKWGSFTLPLDLGSLGAPRCKLNVEPLFFFVMKNTSGTAKLGFPLPNDAGLAGATLYMQGMATDSTNALRLVFSNGGGLAIGEK